MMEIPMDNNEFKTLMRFMMQDIIDAREEQEINKKDILLDKIIDKMQKALED